MNLVIDWTIMEPGKLMSTLRAIRLPDELVSGIEHAAVSQGKSPDQWVEDTLRAQLEWSSTARYEIRADAKNEELSR